MRIHAVRLGHPTGVRPIRAHLTPLQVVGALSLVLFLLVLIDVALRPRSFYDLWLTQTMQRVQGPHTWKVNDPVAWLTDSQGAILAWAITLGAFLVARRWAAVVVVGLIADGRRDQPAHRAIRRADAAPPRHAGPGQLELGGTVVPERPRHGRGHALRVLYVVARDVAHPWLRWAIRTGCVTIIVASGIQRIWIGAHWSSDVLGGFALGLFLLALLVALWERLRAIPDLPRWTAQRVWLAIPERSHR